MTFINLSFIVYMKFFVKAPRSFIILLVWQRIKKKKTRIMFSNIGDQDTFEMMMQSYRSIHTLRVLHSLLQ